MKGKFLALFILGFVILSGIGIGFGIHFGKEIPPISQPGLSEDVNKDENDKPDQDVGSGENNGDNDFNDNVDDDNIPGEERPDKPNFDEDDNNDSDNNTDTPINPEQPEEKPTEPIEPEEVDYIKIYLALDNEIDQLKEYYEALTFVVVESHSFKDIENVTYTLSFNMDELLMLGIIDSFETIKIMFEDYINGGEFTQENESYTTTYEFIDESFELVVRYLIGGWLLNKKIIG